MKSFELFDGQPNQISIDLHFQPVLQNSRRLGGSCFAVTLLSNQRRSVIEAMRLVPLHVVDERFVV